jgi:hypothetical protein
LYHLYVLMDLLLILKIKYTQGHMWYQAMERILFLEVFVLDSTSDQYIFSVIEITLLK